MDSELKAKLLGIIKDWDQMADPDYEGDGEAEFQAKYGKGTSELIDILKEALESTN